MARSVGLDLRYLGMKTVEKTLILILVLFYNNDTKTKTKMSRSVYGIEIIDRSKTKRLERKYVENNRIAINLSR